MAATMEEPTLPSIEIKSKPALTPPTSEEGNKGDPTSDLSDLELDDDEDEADIEPDHYYGDGKVPVFKPTMDQFRSFPKFIKRIDKHGMKSGIVKVVPPKEWTDSLPALDEQVKTIKVKNPITQEFSGTPGTYTQANIEKQRSYNLPQWKALTEESQHQPPARRGEARRNVARPTAPRTGSRSTSSQAAPPRQTTGRTTRRATGRGNRSAIKDEPIRSDEEEPLQVPPTPVSPYTAPQKSGRSKAKPKAKPRGKATSKPDGNQPKSVSERRKYNRQDAAEDVDEAAFEWFDYRFQDNDEFTSERCAELETQYWKSLTFATPMYGADMPGSLFDESTTSWNVAKLENILDVLGQKVPGVNTAYLYLGMWKATFAWHLEDVDLYSINYIHFGAPKQWYSISQEDARRFEAAMRSVWPNDAKNCGQFLRHKTYLISPALLQSQFNIKVNRLVHNEGEFVITFPYGYHSGYNLGYNCAESVNFATESWLDYGRIAKKCDCEADSVWIDVNDIERRLRGEPTPEYYEETDDEDELAHDLPSPPASVQGKKAAGRKRKRDPTAAHPARVVKRIKIPIKTPRNEPCSLCPNDPPNESLLPTDTGSHAHRICAQYTPETFITKDSAGNETICNVASIDKARMELKCIYCRVKKGACFQCSYRKCTRPYHATCAMPGGVRVDHGMTPHYDNNIEYFREGRDFRCRFHRPKRAKYTNSDGLEADSFLRKACAKLRPQDNVQAQHHFGDHSGEIFAGIVIENRPQEQTLLMQVLPEGDRFEVEWKWLLAQNPEESQLLRPSAHALPLPDHLLQTNLTSRSEQFGLPTPDDMFLDPNGPLKWAEFDDGDPIKNAAQAKVDLSKPNQLWYYLGKKSTEARSYFTHDPKVQHHNPASNFLDTLRVDRSRIMPSLLNTPALMQRSNVVSRPPANAAFQQSREYQYKPKSHQLGKNMYPPYGTVLHTSTPKVGTPQQATASNSYISGVPPQATVQRQSSSLSQSGVLPSPRPMSSGSDVQHGRTPSGSQLAAPMANMSPSMSKAPSTPTANPPPETPMSEYSIRIKDYTYLKNSFCRAKPYRTPYPGPVGYFNRPSSGHAMIPPPNTNRVIPIGQGGDHASPTNPAYHATDWHTPALSGIRPAPSMPKHPPAAQSQQESPREAERPVMNGGTGYDGFLEQVTESAAKLSPMAHASSNHGSPKVALPSPTKGQAS
ncbi:MAG: hypothetical protein M1828_003114 [Chrysothrix sp. TS-e1954]|nr:MAG: hypothetical protein M1828_003114 [Chrysothrix sp. TS-e1954]